MLISKQLRLFVLEVVTKVVARVIGCSQESARMFPAATNQCCVCVHNQHRMVRHGCDVMGHVIHEGRDDPDVCSFSETSACSSISCKNGACLKLEG